ncbi:MAG: polysaccharide pyruvyl transferase CsaB, partial [Anaerolineales bacterium]
MNKHVLIAGYYGFHNNGDEAILRVLLEDLRQAEPNVSICILSGDPESTRRNYGVEAITHGDINGIIEQARRSDALIVGGGGIFQDYWGSLKHTLLTSEQAGLPFYSSLPILGHLLDKPVLIYAVGAGPFLSPEAKELTRLSFEISTISTVRDRDSLELLHSIGVPAKKIQITADPAFALHADSIHSLEILNALSVDPSHPFVGVCLRNWDLGIEQSIWQAGTAAGLDNFADCTGCSFIFLPFQDLLSSPLTQDSLAAMAVIQHMKHQQDCVLVPSQEDPTVTAGILATCAVVVGMRYHSIVFAASSGVPLVALAYDSKVAHLMYSLGLEEETIRLSDVSGANLTSSLARVWENRPFYRKQLDGKAAMLKRSTAGNFHAIQKLLMSGSARNIPGQDVDHFIKEFALQQSLALVEQKIRNENLSGQLMQQEHTARELVERIQEKDHALNVLEDRLKSGQAWKIMLLWSARNRFAPPGSRRERVLRSLWWRLNNRSFHAVAGAFQPPFPFNDRYMVEDNSRVTLYTDDPLLYPGFPVRKLLSNTQPDTLQVSLIASVKNEAGNITKWTECIQKQNRPPDEIVILDGGSTDGTDRLLEEWRDRCPVPVKVIRAPGTNIARGRNIATGEARYPIIAVTDFGCEPKPDWLEKLIQPFKLEPETNVSAGFYESVSRTGKVLSGNGLWPGLGKIDPQGFLPSSRSVAFLKEALDAVGGHPEWLTRTGDDTYLDLELKRLGGKWAFVPEAQVKWIAPEKLGAYLKKMYLWASGDGESGVHAHYYWRYFQQLGIWLVFSFLVMAVLVGVLVLQPAPTLLWAGLCLLAWVGAFVGLSLKEKLPPPRLIQKGLGHAAQVLGFLKGAGNLKEVEQRRKNDLTGVFFILSGVPFDDSGGG